MEYIECGWCNKTIIKKNSLHKFCSSSCKKKSWRKANNKPEYPTFINNEKTVKKRISKTKNYVSAYTPTLEENIPTIQKDEPIIKIKPKSIQPSFVQKEIPIISDNPLRDAKEKKVMDELMAAFDAMIEKERKKYKKSIFYSKKEIEREIRKLDVSKREKVVKQANKLNLAIRKKANKISKQINKGKISNKKGQEILDKIRSKEVKKIVKIIKDKSWILLYKNNYNFY